MNDDELSVEKLKSQKVVTLNFSSHFSLSLQDFMSIPMLDVNKSGAEILGFSLVDKNAVGERVNRGIISKVRGVKYNMFCSIFVLKNNNTKASEEKCPGHARK